MAKSIHALDGFTLSDLTYKDGLILEIGNEHKFTRDEEFPYSTDIPLTNEEALNLLNMNDFQDEDDTNNDNDDDKDKLITVCGISFEKLKTKMTDVLGDGKVNIMKLIKQNGIGEIIPHDAQVSIKYIGHFEYRDEPFDSSFTRGGVETFCLNVGRLIPGLEIALTTMRRHEIAMFIVHPDLAYGKFGCAPRIPPNEQILFVVHLVDYVDSGSIASFENLSSEEKKMFSNVVKRVQAKFNVAKDCFNKHKNKQAIREYSRALEWLEHAQLQNQEEEDEANRLLSRGYNNLAVCYNIENMPRRACNACNRVAIPTVKTHFNRGRALLRMGEYTSAMKELQIAHKMEPQNDQIIREIRLANEKQRKFLDIEKQLWGNCLKIDVKEKKESSFEKAAREMCEAFSSDDHILRQPLPESLTPDEDKYIREQAAAFGLTVTAHERYGRQITYLNKPSY
ncbi:Peptidyl-prolyl cis-trans isomerase FKBP6 [Habropoda laboriosa]|uniref:peptidylprolyl isomerase n=1 Tax=Habropoda laboriosa TaxID=597456 RepID=A0A0L7QY84_9HYME|nr:Peptidyl-prolyl cis-trans isomerase FKBP6 [Habropoda laboriosa]